MKRPLSIVFGGLLLGIAGYVAVYLATTHNVTAHPDESHNTLGWLKSEYHLSDAQFAKVIELHEAYQPTCMEMCRKVDVKNAQLRALLSSANSMTPEIKRVVAESAVLRAECEQAMLDHFYKVASVMPEAEGKRYLFWVQQQTVAPGPMRSVDSIAVEHSHQ